LHDQFNKPALFVETDHGNKSYGCTNNEQAVMVMNRLGTSGCAGFNIWRTFGSYAPELDELVRVSDFMNTDFITSTFDAGNGAWKHQSSLWEVKVVNEDNSDKPNVSLRELQFAGAQDKSGGFGTIYNRQFNVQNFAQDLLAPADVQTTSCYIGNDSGDFEDDGYMFLEGWERTDIEWNDKEKLKIEGLKNNTDYRIKYYDYDTYNLRGSAVQNSSWNGKLKIKHPKLAYKVKNSTMPIYNFTVEEVSNSKSGSINNVDTDEPIDIEESKLFPNPNNGNFIVEHFSRINTYKIIDISGKILISDSPVRPSSSLNLNLELSNGVYILVINNSIHLKFIVYEA